MSSILEFPQDIRVLLDLAKHLDVSDLISLFSTCRVIRRLQLQKSLWLDAFIRMREVERQPHPLSNVENLSALSLHQLQHAVQHANRLAKNLRSHNPRPTHIRHLSVEAGYEFLVSIGEIFMRRGNTIKARELWQAARPLFIRSSQMGEAIAVDARLKKLSLEVIPPPDPAADQTVVGRSIGQEQLTMSLAPEESLREMMQSSAAIQSHGPVEGSTEILQVRPSTDENYASRKALAL